MAAATDRVFIALGSYEGSAWLEQQLASIVAQSESGWRLLVRDDGSRDESLQIARAFADRDSRIELLEDDRGRIGAAANFDLLLRAALDRGAELVALCDQDDVWRSDKLARQSSLMQRADPATPTLQHSDLRLVDPEGSEIAESFMAYQGIRHEEHRPLATLLVQNFVTGCSCMANRALLERALPVPRSAIMHDWWLALVAAALGQIAFDPAPLVDYRQHRENRIGAKAFWPTVNPLRKSLNPFSEEGTREFRDTLDQARALRDWLRSLGPSAAQPRAELAESRALVERYCGLFDEGVGRVARVLGVLRARVGRQDPIRNSLLLMKLLGVPREVLSGVG